MSRKGKTRGIFHSQDTDEMMPTCTLCSESCKLTLPKGDFCAYTFSAAVAKEIILFIKYGILIRWRV